MAGCRVALASATSGATSSIEGPRSLRRRATMAAMFFTQGRHALLNRIY